MTTTTLPADRSERSEPLAHKAGFVRDLSSVAYRAVRGMPREPEFFIPALIIPVFFFVVNVGALQDAAEGALGVDDFKAFQLPVALIFAVTGISRASALVTDIQGGYFDRLLMTPVTRPALLLGLMVADFVAVLVLSLPVLALGLILGVSFGTGVAGMVIFVLLAAFWGLAFTGFPYAIALKTGNPGAVNSSFILFFPFAFLTSTFLPERALTGWLATVADYNPVTYILRAMRSLTDGWDAGALAQGAAAIVGVGVISFALAFAALRGRVARG